MINTQMQTTDRQTYLLNIVKLKKLTERKQIRIDD